MKIPIKFEINTEDFKIYFDNQKKTHVIESLDTGEQTNIGVLGILMQMGIIKPVEQGIEEKIKTLSERLNDLETKINGIIKRVDSVSIENKEITENREEKEFKETPQQIDEPEEDDEPKSEINKRIMKKVLETTEEQETEDEQEDDEEEVEIEEDEENDSNVKKESEEEINNWAEI